MLADTSSMILARQDGGLEKGSALDTAETLLWADTWLQQSLINLLSGSIPETAPTFTISPVEQEIEIALTVCGYTIIWRATSNPPPKSLLRGISSGVPVTEYSKPQSTLAH